MFDEYEVIEDILPRLSYLIRMCASKNYLKIEKEALINIKHSLEERLKP